jgi:hypothetical protein
MPTTRCDRTPAWAQLKQHHAQTGQGFDLRLPSRRTRADLPPNSASPRPMCLPICPKT